jgi:predicted RNase H-like HicB family nuclease
LKGESFVERNLKLSIEVERDKDRRVIADIPALPGVMAYGHHVAEAIRNAQVLALKHVAELLDNTTEGDAVLSSVTFECPAASFYFQPGNIG